MSEKIHKPNYEVENLKAQIQHHADKAKVGILPKKDDYFNAFLKIHNKEISSLQSEIERLKGKVDFWQKSYIKSNESNIELAKEIERLKSSMRSNGHFQREDLNPEFLKTIDGINERLFGNSVAEEKKEPDSCNKCHELKIDCSCKWRDTLNKE
jgi:hypothetical protein